MKLFYGFCRALVLLYARPFCKMQIKGLENVPLKGGVIIASNHIGTADPPFVGIGPKREFYFLAKKELFKNPFLGTLIKNLNSIPVNRSTFDKNAIEAAGWALKQGYGLVVFPEGTRSKTGDLRRGKPGVGFLARKALVPIVPAYIQNSRGFTKLIFTGKRLKVTYGKPISADWIRAIPDDNDGYRIIADEVMSRIAELKDAADASV